MIRNSRRVTALAIAGALTLAPAVTGCGAGMNPETARPTQLTEGVNVSRNNLAIQIRNLFVLGPADGQTLAVGASAPVYATLINSATDGQPDKLVAVSSNVSGQPTPLTGIDLPVGRAVSLNGPAGPLAVLSGLTKTLVGGEIVEVALQFQRAGVVKVMVPVIPQRGDFQTYPAAPTPVVSSPTANPAVSLTATPAGKKKSKKSAKPTPTP